MTPEPDLALVLISPLGINQPRLMRKGGCSEKEEGISVYKSISHVSSEKVEARKKTRGHLVERRPHERGGLFPIIINSHIRRPTYLSGPHASCRNIRRKNQKQMNRASESATRAKKRGDSIFRALF
ncbi:hypothetical protein CDAR_35621 [Caerostris darwini]|uniref:Uncharacterized protein n=1 Tax=Caerostris darwini TaxID=1538125 RepID=A0AAV4VBR5_9ARAC|nr:hypothetical protein CDAR_35621 [Caerostris darwini]